MRIGIDARMMGPDSRGIGRYVERLISHLAEIDTIRQVFDFAQGDNNNVMLSQSKHDYVVFTRKEAAHLVPATMRTIITSIRWYTIAEQAKLGKIFDAEKLDMILVPHWNAPIFMKTPLAITIHDMILWEHPSLASTTLSPIAYWAKYLFYCFIIATNAKRAKLILTVSESAKNSILRNLKVQPEKIVVTPLGINPFENTPHHTLSPLGARGNNNYPPPSMGKGARRAGEGCSVVRPYILSVGSGYPHKNMATFFKVAKELMANDPKLTTIIAGTDPAFIDRLKEQAEDIIGKNINRVEFPGMVSDKDLGWLYAHANALIFTSCAEGFGLPPLEAALCGASVIASDIDTSREMLENSVPLVHPSDTDGYVAAYQKIMADPAYKTSILSASYARANEYSWDKTAQQTAEAVARTFSTP